MLSWREDGGVIEITLDGELKRADYDEVVAAMERVIDAHGRLRVVEVIRDIGAIDPSVWWRDLAWASQHMGDVARAAVVTDSGWIGPLTRAVSALLPAEVRVFPLAELDAARHWARG